MRNLLILILGAAVIWLLIERNRLTDELAAAEKTITISEKKLADVEKKLAVALAPRVPGAPPSPGAPPRRESWLDTHIERGARALETPAKRGL